MKFICAVSLLVIVSGAAWAQADLEAGGKRGCYYNGQLYPHGSQITTGYADDGGDHYVTWTCVNGRWQ